MTFRFYGTLKRSWTSSCIRVRPRKDSSRTMFTLTGWFSDVIRTRSLRPSNPILAATVHGTEVAPSARPVVPEFDRMFPHHLKVAALEASNIYKVGLAELEVRLTGMPEKSLSGKELLMELERLEDPIQQIRQIGELFCDLASSPDQLEHWRKENEKTRRIFENLKWQSSNVVYKSLPHDVLASLKVAYMKQGAHTSRPESRTDLQRIESALQGIRFRLKNCPQYWTLSKNDKLRLVSDLYNWIGYTKLQADLLGYSRVYDLLADMHNTLSTPDEVLLEHARSIALKLKDYVPKVDQKLDRSVEEFLGQRDDLHSPSALDLQLTRARWEAEKILTLPGVLQGVADFFDAMFSIRVEYEANSGWNPNVRILHLIDTETDGPLGCILLDPFGDPYWRPTSAKDRVSSQAVAKCLGDNCLALVVVSLRIKPTWDDAPAPLTFNDARDLLYQMGKALQIVLTHSKRVAPGDITEFLGVFMELWIQNDGFLQRLAQLSEKGGVFEQSTIETLRKDYQKRKSAKIMESAFLASLHIRMWEEFHPEGEESLGSFQARVAQEFVLPEPIKPDDVGSYILDISRFQDAALPQSELYSEFLAAMVFEKFQTIDLRNRDEVERLGRGVRDLLLSEKKLVMEDFERLCKSSLSADHVMSVYQFR